MQRLCCSHTMRQKSATVWSRGACEGGRGYITIFIYKLVIAKSIKKIAKINPSVVGTLRKKKLVDLKWVIWKKKQFLLLVYLLVYIWKFHRKTSLRTYCLRAIMFKRASSKCEILGDRTIILRRLFWLNFKHILAMRPYLYSRSILWTRPRKGQHEEGSPTLLSSAEQCCHVVTLKTKILRGL